MIKDFKAGIKVCQAVLVRVQKVGNSSNGGVFARGMLEDNSGRIAFICFDAVLVDKLRELEGPTAFMMGGNVDINKFNNDMTLQVVIQRLENLLPQDDISNLLPHGDFDVEAYKTKLANYINSRSNLLSNCGHRHIHPHKNHGFQSCHHILRAVSMTC